MTLESQQTFHTSGRPPVELDSRVDVFDESQAYYLHISLCSQSATHVLLETQVGPWFFSEVQLLDHLNEIIKQLVNMLK